MVTLAELAYKLYKRCQDAPKQFQKAGDHALHVHRLVRHLAAVCKRQQSVINRRRSDKELFADILSDLRQDLQALDKLVQSRPRGRVGMTTYSFSNINEARERLKEHQNMLDSHLSLFGIDIILSGNAAADLPDASDSEEDKPQQLRLFFKDWEYLRPDEDGDGETVLYVHDNLNVREVVVELENELEGKWHIGTLYYGGESIYTYHNEYDPDFSK